MSSKPYVSNKLVFSKHNPRKRKRAFILVGVLTLLQLCLIWPIYPVFSSPTPQILGFPLSFVWVIAILILSFTSLLVFFLTDSTEESN